MTRLRPSQRKSLEQRFPPSPECQCAVCVGYCARPGWWTVAQAADALEAGYGARMMLEIAPEGTFGVLSPAFRGCEGGFALQEFAHAGCTFLVDGLCQLHAAGHVPLECRYCHHERPGMGVVCHAGLEKDWRSLAGVHLVERWSRARGLWQTVHRMKLDCPTGIIR